MGLLKGLLDDVIEVAALPARIAAAGFDAIEGEDTASKTVEKTVKKVKGTSEDD